MAFYKLPWRACVIPRIFTFTHPAKESKTGMVAPPKFVFGQNMEGRVKRQADEQLDPDTVSGDEDSHKDSTDEAGEFKKASANVMSQRSIASPSSAFKDKAVNVGGCNQSFVAAGFPAPSKPLFSTGSPPDSQPTSPTTTSCQTGSFSGQTLSFATSTVGSSSFSSPGNVPTLNSTTSSTTFQSQTSATTTVSYPPQNNSAKNVFASAGAVMPPDPSKNVFATHGVKVNEPTVTTNVFVKRGTDETSSTHSGSLSISSVGTMPSSHSGLSNVTHYRTTTSYKAAPGSGYSSVENSDTEQDDSRPILKTPLLVVSSSNKPVLTSVSSSLEDSRESGLSGNISSSRSILKPSSLTAQTVALQATKVSSLIKPASVSSLDTKTENKDKASESEVENGCTGEVASSSSESEKENGKTVDSNSSSSSFTTGTKENFFVRLQKPDESNVWIKPQTILSNRFGKEGVTAFNQDTESTVTNSNYWAQYSKSTDSFSSAIKEKDKDDTEQNKTSSFVFGRNLDDRVTAHTPGKRPLEEDSEDSVQSGESQSKRVKETPTHQETETSNKALKESASAYEEAKESNRLKLNEVPTVTGEENEENVLQAQCKLFLFDPVSHSWLEKGRGMLRINDLSQSSDVLSFQSRLVMRTQGSLRVILNTKIWTKMSVEKASAKSVRITAMDSEGAKVYLIMANPKDAEQIFSAIDYRIHALKRYEELQEEKTVCSSSTQETDNAVEKTDSRGDTTKSKPVVEEKKPVSEDQPSSTTEDQV
ncbi:ran-binding protein 3-like isoform X2 [Ptychodera flava]|uniref:ran-binding protein 3-like isoform X2 n=1 Tax=Ptychodera flava TaxID=63121 RepID=UPI00396A82B4